MHGGPNKLSLGGSLGDLRASGHFINHELIRRPSFTEHYHARAVLLFCNFNHSGLSTCWAATKGVEG